MRWFVGTVLVAGCAFHVPAQQGSLDVDAAPDQATIDAPVQQLAVTIAAIDDDALQDPDGKMNVAYPWTSLYTANHWGALRFALPGIERGATILDASLALTIDSLNEDDPDVAITSEAASDAPPLVVTAFDISTRPLATARVMWVATGIGQGLQHSPDIAPVLQERVADPAWNAGAHVLLVFDVLATSSFEFRQYDFTPLGMYAATLTVHFTNP